MELIVHAQGVLLAGNCLQRAREMHDALMQQESTWLLPDIANQVT